ncbi:DUF1275 domain-containing protein [Alloscardovia omnicolens]|uniref:YoaK family protein n=1 Tax=Alloscardovia omnicolens TaxID=419015 RepID=UPI000C7613BF|nr:YoaK family protein [Alloscardovia omnicolens]PKY79311.1 DUF1275 domain-containing protein [Alloscardovia omnicolens]
MDIIPPHHRRNIAITLGFIGGAIDVYCHTQFKTLVATQTGNVVMMASDFFDKKYSFFIAKLVAIILFAIGFVAGIYIKQHARTALWRIYALIPMTVATVILPFIHSHTVLSIMVLSFGTGIVMNSYAGTKIETVPYTIMMTSGNFRRMLSSIYAFVTTPAKKRSAQVRRDVSNYVIIVLSFLAGAFVSAVAVHVCGAYAVWLVTLALLVVSYLYATSVLRENLKDKVF